MANELKPRILVIGVGGAGGNAVDNMIEANLQGVDFYVANTDAQALSRSKTNNRIQLGPDTTDGLGAGARPEVGAAAAEESSEEVAAVLDGAHMVFIAAGMGGGTGTGAAPVIARAAHKRGILTVGVITKPFSFEGTHRMQYAEDGVDKMQDVVDTLIVVPNQNLFRVANQKTTITEAFRMADDVLYCGVKGITDLITSSGLINLDFADVRTIIKGMGSAMMGMGEAEGEGRALEAARSAIENPLLDDASMKGARGVLINIIGGPDMTLFEVDEAAAEVKREIDADEDANIIMGSTFDPDLDGRIRVSVVAAGMPERTTRESKPRPAEAKAIVEEPYSPTSYPEPDVTPSRPTIRPLPAANAAPDYLDEPKITANNNIIDDVEAMPEPENVRRREFVDRSKPAQPEPEQGSGFSNLFSWRRDDVKPEDVERQPPAQAAASSNDDEIKQASFDDADLEIPAFLRRSANN
ncbi:MAG: Cell division protein FtsZ [Hyphomonas sp. TMED17]|nr:MAG: Cell division protein FtsZ [Hyphomonas sp. TMED17]